MHVLSAFGSNIRKAAEVLGWPYKRVWNWSDRGLIPQEWHQPLLDRAAELGIELQPQDFVVHLKRPAQDPRKSSIAGKGEPHGKCSF